jgi:hypothetical protein
MATNVRIKVGGVYKDPDELFKLRGSSSPRANTGLKIGSQDFADRYYASTGDDTPSGSSTCYVKNGGSYSDVLSLFRDIAYTEPPTASITGSPSVASGGGGGGSWDWAVAAEAGIYRYRAYVTGHGGAWTYPSPVIYSDSGTFLWTSPLGNPDFSSTPGSYTWNVEVEDTEERTATDTFPFTVS